MLDLELNKNVSYVFLYFVVKRSIFYTYYIIVIIIFWSYFNS